MISSGATISDQQKIQQMQTACSSDIKNYAYLQTKLQILLSIGADINKSMMLHYAQYLSVVDWALSRGANLNQLDSNGNTALYRSVSNNPKIAKYLLQKGISFDSSDGPELLSKAVCSYYSSYPETKDVIRMLIQRGADIKKTALLSSAKNVEFAKWLISMGGDIKNESPNLVSTNFDRTKDINLAKFFMSYGFKYPEYNMSSSMVSAMSASNYQEIFHFFRGLGVNLKGLPLLHSAAYYHEKVKWLIQNGADIHANSYGCTALHNATQYLEVVKILVSAGIDINAEDSNERTALYNACYYNKEVVSFLFANGARFSPSQGPQLIERAASGSLPIEHKKAIVEMLLSKGADMRKSMVLFKTHDIELIKWLIAKGGDIYLVDDNGKNALYHHVGSCYNQERNEIIRFLLEKGLTLTEQEIKFLVTSSMYSSYVHQLEALVRFFNADLTAPGLLNKVRNLEVAKYLVAHGAEVNALDENGKNPLYSLLVSGQTQIVQWLLQQGAKYDEEDLEFLFGRMVATWHTDIVESLIKAGIDVNKSFALHKAPAIPMIELLIKYGADINLRNNYEQSVLYGKNYECMQVLLAKGARFNPEKLPQLLINAVPSNNKLYLQLILDHIDRREIQKLPVLHKVPDIATAQQLIGLGADISLKDQYGRNALYYAAMKYSYDDKSKHIELVQFFINRGLSFDERDKLSILKQCIGYRNKAIAEIVLSSGLDISKEFLFDNNQLSPGIIEILIKYGADIKLLDASKKSALYHAAKNHNLELTKFFLSKGLQFDPENLNPLLESASLSYIPLSKLLISHGADVKKSCILHSVGDYDKAVWWIENGADVNLKNSQGKTALYYAVIYNRIPIAKLLIKKGVKFGEDELPFLLDRSVQNNKQDSVKLLVEHGAKIEGAGILHKVSYVEMADWLIRQGADVNHIDKEGNTVLHSLLSRNVNDQIIRHILELINRDLLFTVNKEGKTPLHYANERHKEKIASEILSKMNFASGSYEHPDLVSDHYPTLLHDMSVNLAGESEEREEQEGD